MAASHYVALVFGCLFILAGLVKLIPLDANQQGHGLPDMYAEFQHFIDVLPLRDLLGVKTAAMYISLVGAAESILGAVLAFGRPTFRIAAALPLLVIMLGASYTLITVGKPVAETIPSIVFGSALAFVLFNPQGLDGKVEAKSKTS